MEDQEMPDAMNLDLNLGPASETGSGSIPTEIVNHDEWMDDPIDRIREAVRLRSRRWRRWRFSRPSPEIHPLQMELNEFIGNSGTLLEGEGSIAAEERTSELPKACENSNGFLVDDMAEKKDDEEKGSKSDGSFFDCNICLDFAREPVVTCCGHLFCWPCLYRWLHLHSDANECPVCKGEVSTKTLTPIYGRGNNKSEPEEDATLKIPSRPQGRRVESLRQTFHNTPFGFPVEEMIRRLGSRFDLTPPRDNNTGNPRDTAERTNFLLNRILTSRGLRGEQNPVPPPDETVDLAESNLAGTGAGGRENRRLHSLLLRRQSSSPGITSSLSFNTAFSSAFEAYFRTRHVARNQEQSPPVDDRDSFSSIAAVINSESQVDTAVEIDSMVSLSTSTSTSRRRGDTSRVSDVDSGDSRAPRRRRLN